MQSNPRRFVVLTTQRSGSTWLADMLHNHDQIRMFGEIFLDRPVKQQLLNTRLLPPVRFYEYNRSSLLPRPVNLWRYLGRIDRWNNDKSAVGFKLMYNQLKRNKSVMLSLLKHRRYKIIHLARRNYLETAISAHIHRLSGLSHIVKGKNENVTHAPIHVSVDGLVKAMEQQDARIAKQNKQLAKWEFPHLEVTYEQMASDLSTTMQSICSFLGVNSDNLNLSSHYVKISKKPYREQIINFDEICSAIAESRFKHLLQTFA